MTAVAPVPARGGASPSLVRRAIIHFLELLKQLLGKLKHAPPVFRLREFMKHQHEALAGYPIVVTFPVLWGDQDAFGHVNNLAYLRWCETVRVEYLEKAGMWVPLPPKGVGPILASIHCDYKLPLNYPDTVHVGARVTRIGNTSLGMEHRIVSHKHDDLAAEVDSTIVMLDYSAGRPSPVPAEIRARIAQIEEREFAAAAPAAKAHRVRRG